MGRLRDFLVGYVGTTGELGLLGVLNLGIPPQSDAAGYAARRWAAGGGNSATSRSSRSSATCWKRSCRSFASSRPQRPAQVRLRVGDVSHARITPTLNDLGYARTRETSLGNLRLLHASGPAASRAAGGVPRGGRVPAGRQADLPLGRAVRVARDERRSRRTGPRPRWSTPSRAAC